MASLEPPLHQMPQELKDMMFEDLWLEDLIALRLTSKTMYAASKHAWEALHQARAGENRVKNVYLHPTNSQWVGSSPWKVLRRFIREPWKLRDVEFLSLNLGRSRFSTLFIDDPRAPTLPLNYSPTPEHPLFAPDLKSYIRVLFDHSSTRHQGPIFNPQPDFEKFLHKVRVQAKYSTVDAYHGHLLDILLQRSGIARLRNTTWQHYARSSRNTEHVPRCDMLMVLIRMMSNLKQVHLGPDLNSAFTNGFDYLNKPPLVMAPSEQETLFPKAEIIMFGDVIQPRETIDLELTDIIPFCTSTSLRELRFRRMTHTLELHRSLLVPQIAEQITSIRMSDCHSSVFDDKFWTFFVRYCSSLQRFEAELRIKDLVVENAELILPRLLDYCWRSIEHISLTFDMGFDIGRPLQQFWFPCLHIDMVQSLCGFHKLKHLELDLHFLAGMLFSQRHGRFGPRPYGEIAMHNWLPQSLETLFVRLQDTLAKRWKMDREKAIAAFLGKFLKSVSSAHGLPNSDFPSLGIIVMGIEPLRWAYVRELCDELDRIFETSEIDRRIIAWDMNECGPYQDGSRPELFEEGLTSSKPAAVRVKELKAERHIRFS